MGHQPSDEITAFLAVQRATTPDAFRAAFASYGVGGQNMLFASRAGEIGQVMAAWLPKRAFAEPPDLVLDPADPAQQWHGFEDATQLPWARNAASGFIASANNPPVLREHPVIFFPIVSERVERLQAELGRMAQVNVADLQALQRDVHSSASLKLKDGLLKAIEEAGLGSEWPGFVARLRVWDGSYEAGAAGPVAFETLLYHVVQGVRAVPDSELRTDWSAIVSDLLADLDALPPGSRAALLASALADADRDAARFRDWGEMHRVQVRPLLGHLPKIGRWFRIGDYPASGSRETVMKTSHGLVRDRHACSFGAQARFVADLSDPDDNWFVLFGGQDGWLGSENLADQLGLWRDGGYIRMPLSDDAIARDFPHLQILCPASAS